MSSRKETVYQGMKQMAWGRSRERKNHENESRGGKKSKVVKKMQSKKEEKDVNHDQDSTGVASSSFLHLLFLLLSHSSNVLFPRPRNSRETSCVGEKLPASQTNTEKIDKRSSIHLHLNKEKRKASPLISEQTSRRFLGEDWEEGKQNAVGREHQWVQHF